MSTIAYRDGVMAADTLGVNGANLTRETRKLHRLDDAIVGFTGNYVDGLTFVDWWRVGHDMDSLPKFIVYRDGDAPDFVALVLNADGLNLWTEHFQSSPVPDEFFTIGSGAMAARAAMVMGASAERAVEVAMLVDLHTGGKVEAERLYPAQAGVARL